MLAHIVGVLLSLIAFVGGLKVMRRGLEGMADGRLATLLERLVKTPTRGILTGTVATAIVQSSAALTAITVGLVAARSITFRNGLGVVLGSNVGSTLTPQILNLNLWGVVVPALALGMFCVFSRRDRLRKPGEALVGFACIFIALQALKVALSPLSASTWFRSSLEQAGHHVLLAVLVGCVASAVIQSSTATTIITMALAGDHLISVVAAIAIVLGANVGTCLTSIIAAIGESRQAQQVALAHVILNVLGAAVFLPFLYPFAHLITSFGGNAAQQIANAHTVFNIICTIAIWPFTKQFAAWIERILPDEHHA